MNLNRDLPIGVFDSGIGGLTVLKALKQRLPSEGYIYVGDTARVPYGIRSNQTVQRYALEISEFLVSRGIKLLVVACNTASAVAIEALREAMPVPVVGVIEPGARAAAERSEGSAIGVIGTETTIKSNSYMKAIRALRPEVKVITKACPLFVPLVEEGWTEGPIAELVAERYLSELKEQDIDTLVLGCTHYPLLKNVIKKTMGPGIDLIDSAEETARAVEEVLKDQGLRRDKTAEPEIIFYVTDGPEKFSSLGERFLGSPIGKVNILSLEEVGYEKGWQKA